MHPRDCQPVQCIDGTHPLRQKRRHAHYYLRLRKQGKTGPRFSRHASQGLAAWILTEKGRRERMTCAHSSPYITAKPCTPAAAASEEQSSFPFPFHPAAPFPRQFSARIQSPHRQGSSERGKHAYMMDSVAGRRDPHPHTQARARSEGLPGNRRASPTPREDAAKRRALASARVCVSTGSACKRPFLRDAPLG